MLPTVYNTRFTSVFCQRKGKEAAAGRRYPLSLAEAGLSVPTQKVLCRSKMATAEGKGARAETFKWTMRLFTAVRHKPSAVTAMQIIRTRSASMMAGRLTSTDLATVQRSRSEIEKQTRLAVYGWENGAKTKRDHPLPRFAVFYAFRIVFYMFCKPTPQF